MGVSDIHLDQTEHHLCIHCTLFLYFFHVISITTSFFKKKFYNLLLTRNVHISTLCICTIENTDADSTEQTSWLPVFSTELNREMFHNRPGSCMYSGCDVNSNRFPTSYVEHSLFNVM